MSISTMRTSASVPIRIDTKTTDAVDKVSEAAPATKVVGSYGVDGKAKRIAAPKGLRLDKLANGKVKKVVVK